MAKNRHNQYAKLEDVRLYWHKEQQAIEMTAADKDLPSGFTQTFWKRNDPNFHALFEVLKNSGVLTEESLLSHYPPSSSWSTELVDVLRPTVFPLGYATLENGQYPRLEVDLEKGNLYLGSKPAEDKKVVQHNIILRALTQPEVWDIALIGAWKNEFTLFKKFAEQVTAPETLATIRDTLKMIKEFAVADLGKSFHQVTRRTLIMIDEFSHFVSLMDKASAYAAFHEGLSSAEVTTVAKEIVETVEWLSEFGSRVGIHLVVCSQRFDTASVTPRLRKTLKNRMLLGDTSPENVSLVFGVEKTTMEEAILTPNVQGRIILHEPGRTVYGTACYADLTAIAMVLSLRS